MTFDSSTGGRRRAGEGRTMRVRLAGILGAMPFCDVAIGVVKVHAVRNPPSIHGGLLRPVEVDRLWQCDPPPLLPPWHTNNVVLPLALGIM